MFTSRTTLHLAPTTICLINYNIVKRIAHSYFTFNILLCQVFSQHYYIINIKFMENGHKQYDMKFLWENILQTLKQMTYLKLHKNLK